jgi:hypothetical protein
MTPTTRCSGSSGLTAMCGSVLSGNSPICRVKSWLRLNAGAAERNGTWGAIALPLLEPPGTTPYPVQSTLRASPPVGMSSSRGSCPVAMTQDEALNMFSTGCSSRNPPTGIAPPSSSAWPAGGGARATNKAAMTSSPRTRAPRCRRLPRRRSVCDRAIVMGSPG